MYPTRIGVKPDPTSNSSPQTGHSSFSAGIGLPSSVKVKLPEAGGVESLLLVVVRSTGSDSTSAVSLPTTGRMPIGFAWSEATTSDTATELSAE